MLLSIAIIAIILAPFFILIKRAKERYDEEKYLEEEQRKQDEYYENVKAIREMLEKEQNSNFPKNE